MRENEAARGASGRHAATRARKPHELVTAKTDLARTQHAHTVAETEAVFNWRRAAVTCWPGATICCPLCGSGSHRARQCRSGSANPGFDRKFSGAEALLSERWFEWFRGPFERSRKRRQARCFLSLRRTPGLRAPRHSGVKKQRRRADCLVSNLPACHTYAHWRSVSCRARSRPKARTSSGSVVIVLVILVLLHFLQKAANLLQFAFDPLEPFRDVCVRIVCCVRSNVENVPGFCLAFVLR